MKKTDYENLERETRNYQQHLTSEAQHLAAAGEEAAAGVLLVLNMRISNAWVEFGNVAIVDSEAGTAPPPAAPTGKHRHDFTASVTRGDDPPVCACGHSKKPNGRPRIQQLVQPAKGSAP